MKGVSVTPNESNGLHENDDLCESDFRDCLKIFEVLDRWARDEKITSGSLDNFGTVVNLKE